MSNGHYFDGDTPEAIPVTVSVEGDELHFASRDRAIDLRWPIDAVRLTEDLHPGQPIRLRRKRRQPGRLLLDDPHLFEQLRERSRALRRQDYRHGGSYRRAAVWFGLLLLVGVGLWRGWPLAVEPIARLVPVSLEERLGRAVERLVRQTLASGSGTCRGRAGQQAIERLVARLTTGVKHPYVLRVTVLDHKLINAFAAPGGYIVIFRGLIDKSPGPGAFAGVLAHEIGHVLERHVVENIIQALGISIVLKTMAGDSSGVVGEASDVALTLITRGYGRTAEAEADQVAVRLLNASNISAEGLARFFEFVARREKQLGASDNPYLRTHPLSKERADAVRRAGTGKGPALTESEWTAIKDMCR